MRSPFLLTALFLLQPSVPASAAAESRSFQPFLKSAFQIRVVDTASGESWGRGSGFVVGEGLIASNFHVVSKALFDPEHYHLALVGPGQKESRLAALGVDVVHDLAVLKAGPEIKAPPLGLAPSIPAKGAKLYSLGNPKNLGMGIVEGSSNGLAENTPYEQILFSGAINSGMSGGPALDAQGRVAGINVSTSGNGLGFLVPASFLAALMKARPAEAPVGAKAWYGVVEGQLHAHQDRYYRRILAAPWKKTRLGKLAVPLEITPQSHCFGSSTDSEDSLFEETRSGCDTRDRIFVRESFNTGPLSVGAKWLRSSKLDGFRFSKLYTNRVGWGSNPNSAGKEDVSAWKLRETFVKLHGRSWKAFYGVRRYKNMPSLYDMGLVLALDSKEKEGYIYELKASGLSRENAVALQKAALESLEWHDDH